MSKLKALAGAALVTGATVGWWGYRHGARDFRLVRQQVPNRKVALRILHISDLHLGKHNRALARWLPGLASLRPDLVVVTGDSLSGRDSVGGVLDVLEPFFAFPGVMVGGSHDYYEPRVINPFKYLRGPSKVVEHRPEMPWRSLKTAVQIAGWHWLENSAVSMSIGGVTVNVAGVDDAHYGRDDSAKAIGELRELGDSADVVLGVAHAPYLRVVDTLAEAKVDLILSGHTHGGQIRLPRVGSLVTNSDLPNKYSKGLARYQGDTWLHVSAGLGTSPFAPIRIGCPPEATLLELTPN